MRGLSWSRTVKKSDFNYELPEALIAQAPLPERSASRLLVVPPGEAAFVDRQVRDLPEWLAPGDLLVFNDTRVIPARVFGQKGTGGRVEILIERLLPDNAARVQIGASKSPKPGSRIALDAGGEAEVLGRDGEFYQLRFHVDECAGKLAAESRAPAVAAVHPSRSRRRRRRALPDRVRARTRRGGGADRGPAFRRCAVAGVARTRASSSATSPCTWARAPSSRCAWTTCANTACTANG